MKYKTTRKAIMNNYNKVIRIGYCNLHNLLYYQTPSAYTTRQEGWGADIYHVNIDIAIATGYAPFGNVKPKYDTLRKYEKRL